MAWKKFTQKQWHTIEEHLPEHIPNPKAYRSTYLTRKEVVLVRMIASALKEFCGSCGREHPGANCRSAMVSPAPCTVGSASGHKMELYSTCGVLF